MQNYNNDIFKQYDNYIKRICRRILKHYKNNKLEFDDLYQECMLCLCRINATNTNPQYKYIITSLYNQLINYITEWTEDPLTLANNIGIFEYDK